MTPVPKEAAARAAWIAERLACNREALTALREVVEAATGDPFGRPPIDLRLEPGLVRPGEAVRLVLTVAGDAPPVGTLTVQEDYLGVAPAACALVCPDWRRSAGGWRAEAVFTPGRPGNGRVVWETAEHRLSRVFGVAVPGQAVVTPWVGSNTPPLDEELHRYDLPGDRLLGDWWSPFADGPADMIAYLKPQILNAHRYGDRLAPFVNAGFLLPGYPNSNLFLLDEAVQREGIRQVLEWWEILGLPPLELFASYTPGHSTVAILKELGIPALTSLCVWQNTRDVHDEPEKSWLINHLGSPNAPYYVADDDFRKVAPGRTPLVAFSMGTTSNVRLYEFFAYDGCVTNCIPAQRYTRKNAVAANARRFFTVVDGWLHDARNNPEPLFVTAALENFHRSEDWRQANALAVDYLVRRAGEGRVVFASAADVAAFYQRHYPQQPEQVLFQADALCGLRNARKPACLPDRIEVSNARFHAVFREGEALSQLFWDYTTPWSNPEWADDTAVRNAGGTILPAAIAATVNPLGATPLQADLRGVRLDVSLTPADEGLRAEVRVDTPRPLAMLPLALWDLPLAEPRPGVLPAHARWLPVRDGWTGNQHAVLTLLDVPQGETTVAFTLSGERREPEAARFAVGDGRIQGRTFRTAEGPVTHLWRRDGTAPCHLMVEVPPGASIRYNDGTPVARQADGRLKVLFEDDWQYESPCLTGGVPTAAGGDVTFGSVLGRPVTPYVQHWRMSRPQPGAGRLDGLAYPADRGGLEFAAVAFADRFVNVYEQFQAVGGDLLLYFASTLYCAEPMDLKLLLGCDGPLKLWLDGRTLHHEPAAAPPAMPDAVAIPVRLASGDHEVLIALGSNHGKTWGFFCRAERNDLADDQLTAAATDLRLPTWLVLPG